MFKNRSAYDEIIEILSVLYESVKQKGNVNFHDDKTESEMLFKDLFNVVYDLNLINTNLLNSNSPAIDLADKNKGICYQVTYENSTKKIKDTKLKYHKHGVSTNYPKLIIFIFGEKPPSRPVDNQVQYKKDLYKDIYSLTFEKKEEILAYLKKQLRHFRQEKKTLEIKTIQAVIQFISEQPFAVSEDGNSLEKPYPKEKLLLRFGDYYKVITEEFAELSVGYNQVLLQAKTDYIDDGNSGKIKAYLRRKSRDCLLNNADARIALDKVIQDIKDQIDTEVYEGALRFYIISELMECDIFPLSEDEKKLIGAKSGTS